MRPRTLKSAGGSRKPTAAFSPTPRNLKKGREAQRGRHSNPASVVSSARSSSSASTYKATARKPELDVNNMANFHRENCLKPGSSLMVLKNHHYRNCAEGMERQSPDLARMKRLVAEVSSLKYPLPESIYDRYLDYRLDVVRAVIIGPKGTPYENGLFEVDIFCVCVWVEVPRRCHPRRIMTGGGIASNSTQICTWMELVRLSYSLSFFFPGGKEFS